MDETKQTKSPTKHLLQNSRIYRKMPKPIGCPKPIPMAHFFRTEHLVEPINHSYSPKRSSPKIPLLNPS